MRGLLGFNPFPFPPRPPSAKMAPAAIAPRGQIRRSMRWFRDHVGHGAWLALVALAINFALSFGHVHVAGHHSSESSLLVAALGLSDHGKAKGHSDDGQSDSLCPICMATSAIANALASAPPAIPLQVTQTVIDRPVEAIRLVLALQRAPFQSRGPPIS